MPKDVVYWFVIFTGSLLKCKLCLKSAIVKIIGCNRHAILSKIVKVFLSKKTTKQVRETTCRSHAYTILSA